MKRIVKKILVFISKKSANFAARIGHNPVSLSREIVIDYNNSRNDLFLQKICNAPYTNLYIGHHGKIGVCCINRSHLVGFYPKQTLKEVWFGNSINDLRKRIKHVDLTSGCFLCNKQWQEKAYKTILARNYDSFSTINKYPQTVEFELSNNCNLECIMCSEDNSSKIAQNQGAINEENNPYNDSFLHELEEFIPYFKSAKFLGGEPFVIPIYFKIWELFIKLNPRCKLVIQTNGTILNSKIKQLLESGNFNINISIESLSKSRYELIRKNASFNVMFENLQYFINYCSNNKRFIGISTCIMQQNWQDIPDLILFCNTNKIPITFNRVWEPAECTIWGSSVDLMDEIIKHYKNVKLLASNDVERANLLDFNEMIDLINIWRNELIDQTAHENVLRGIPLFELESKAIKYVINDSIMDVFSENEIFEIERKLKAILSHFKQDPEYKNLLIKMMQIPAEIIQREMLKNTENRIIQQALGVYNKLYIN